jgi:hypothetical protein
VNADEREEIAASVAAHAELGPRYDAALAEGLIERIGDEIDKRVDARLRGMGGPAQQPHPEPAPRQGHPSPGHQIVPPGYQGGQPAAAGQGTAQPPVARRSNGVTGIILGLGSMGLGVGATAVVASHQANSFAQVLMILLIWAAIAVINVAYSQRR